MNSENRNKIILASASPRRKELLENANMDFEIIVSRADEIDDQNADPCSVATENARLKASVVALENPNRLTLGADTVVAFTGKIYGKPKDLADAKRMLSELQGNTHSVFTGICAAVADENKNLQVVCDAEESRVTFKKLTSEQIDEYLMVVNVLDKAGAYAAQEHGEMIIENIDGAFDNVMGLPVQASKKILDTLKNLSHT